VLKALYSFLPYSPIFKLPIIGALYFGVLYYIFFKYDFFDPQVKAFLFKRFAFLRLFS